MCPYFSLFSCFSKSFACPTSQSQSDNKSTFSPRRFSRENHLSQSDFTRMFHGTSVKSRWSKRSKKLNKLVDEVEEVRGQKEIRDGTRLSSQPILNWNFTDAIERPCRLRASKASKLRTSISEERFLLFAAIPSCPS